MVIENGTEPVCVLAGRVKLKTGVGFCRQLAGPVVLRGQFQIRPCHFSVPGAVFNAQVGQLNVSANDFEAVLCGDVRLAFFVLRRARPFLGERGIDFPLELIIERDAANLPAFFSDPGSFGLVHAVDGRVVCHLTRFHKSGVESPLLAASLQDLLALTCQGDNDESVLLLSKPKGSCLDQSLGGKLADILAHLGGRALVAFLCQVFHRKRPKAPDFGHGPALGIAQAIFPWGPFNIRSRPFAIARCARFLPARWPVLSHFLAGDFGLSSVAGDAAVHSFHSLSRRASSSEIAPPERKSFSKWASFCPVSFRNTLPSRR